MTTMAIKFVSLNVRGLRDHKKRQTIFHWLRKKNFDVILLQETHCIDTDIFKWSKEWAGHSLWNVGTNNSKGVSILLKRGTNLNVIKQWNDTSGRIMCAELTDGEEFSAVVYNVYAPNNETERKAFLDNFGKRLKNVNKNLIIGGDFNCALNNSIDREKKKLIADGGNKEILNLITENQLEDIWRRRNPLKRVFSFQGQGKSRIDYWLISRSFDSAVTRCDIIDNPLTAKDHRAITLCIDCEETPSPGLDYGK